MCWNLDPLSFIYILSSLDFPMNMWHFESLSVSQGFLMTSAFCKEGSIHIQNKVIFNLPAKTLQHCV